MQTRYFWKNLRTSLGLGKKFIYLIIINKNKKMKKVFLAVALMAVVAVSCKKVETVETPVVDSTAVQVDSVSVDTTAVDSVTVTK